MGFQTGNINNGNQVEELHMTHKLDEILCKNVNNENQGDFMQGSSAMKTMQKTCIWLTC